MRTLVGIALPPGPQFVAEIRRAWDAGDAILPLDHRLPRPAIDSQIAELGTGILVDDAGRHRLSGRPVEDGDAVVMATSGTSGVPRGVVLTHQAVAASADLTCRRLGVTDTDHWLCCLPPAHIGGLAVVLRSIVHGTPLTIHPAFTPEAVTRAAGQGATLASLVPTMLQRIDPGLFRRILLGGSAPPEDLPANVVVTYGMTETGSGVVYDGRPLDGVQLDFDHDGQILIKSPTLLRCYRDGTDPRIRGGWFPTGDMGHLDPEGRLVIDGRRDNRITTRGYAVWPSAVERRLRTFPGVAEVLVRGEPDPEWGMHVVAILEMEKNATIPEEGTVRDHVRQTMPYYAAPKEVRFVAELPRTSIGKVRRG